MKEKNKGFTLIELLAVIVVLAIIMVIATTLVSKQIKKSKKNANEINKEMIVKAVKTCLVENTEEECDTIEKLQKNGYLDSFEDPWNKKNDNLDDSYTIVISDDDARVIYFGEGITEEVETPPNEYFSWCNSDNGKHTCTDGLTSEGKKWLQGHDDILIFPSTIKTIKDCESNSKNCTNFSDINIDALIATSNVSISASFSDSIINVIKIDGGSFSGGNSTNAKFKNCKIKKLILANASEFRVGQYEFNNSYIDYFEIKSGEIGWSSFSNNQFGTIILGEKVTKVSGNAFDNTKIDKIIIKSNHLKDISPNPTNTFYYSPFNHSSHSAEVVIASNVTRLPKHLFNGYGTSYGYFINAYGIYLYYSISDVKVEGDKTRFSKRDLYDFGLRWDTIPEDIGKIGNESYNLVLTEKDFEYGNSPSQALNHAKKFAETHDWLIIE